ncbi:hypothetical protein H112_07567 [Trichophyton rubrum D6]|uniref:Uncharacterized protein n=4 Tax=Trichophyton TaxID=5550 RepID=A0A178EV56_TRIRU|nr:uncharacterized protein TERG_00168 [Trichophyton rubrum CBS 118892]EZF11377.1 hypothetical protein H100_07594 [Trichophyton rubrum MR850]EZF38202.1 hypothetical protein H102_07558 [Trichophyton rubrum CBS 100081]EZF48838.1 hypothetical protein H103_07579 [Trichophyton rubrum CBS 288.86]EZF59490.1 hypothetical protein H104_07529 [Trichophyton rubrum CBS 289.86]EZF70057.1 hypothetical protein H105_07585 [Trichophyton soudanense CBS 452.61]EZF80746.1 hypothetical protein H110_07572 [Trichophy
MAETRKGKPRITKIKGESNRITKYKTAKSKLSRFRQFQERRSKSKQIEHKDERRRQEAASKDTKVTDTSTYNTENVCVKPPTPTPSTPKNVEPERESPEPPLQYIQPNKILPYLTKNKGFRIDPRTGCTCGWYVFQSAICTHEYNRYRHCCRDKMTKSCLDVFCKSPARQIFIDEVKIPRLC